MKISEKNRILKAHKRNKNITTEERRLIFRLRNEHKEVLDGGGHRGSAPKRAAWEEITRIYNNSMIVSSGERSLEQLRKCYTSTITANSQKETDSDYYQDARSENSEFGTLITGESDTTFTATQVRETSLPDESNSAVPPVLSTSRPLLRNRAPLSRPTAPDLDIDAILASLPEGSDPSAAMARKEHRRRLEMMQEEHKVAMEVQALDEDAHNVDLEAKKLTLEKVKWEAKLAKARYEREFFPKARKGRSGNF